MHAVIHGFHPWLHSVVPPGRETPVAIFPVSFGTIYIDDGASAFIGDCDCRGN
jgi:hypothetical protein